MKRLLFLIVSLLLAQACFGDTGSNLFIETGNGNVLLESNSASPVSTAIVAVSEGPTQGLMVVSHLLPKLTDVVPQNLKDSVVVNSFFLVIEDGVPKRLVRADNSSINIRGGFSLRITGRVDGKDVELGVLNYDSLFQVLSFVRGSAIVIFKGLQLVLNSYGEAIALSARAPEVIDQYVLTESSLTAGGAPVNQASGIGLTVQGKPPPCLKGRRLVPEEVLVELDKIKDPKQKHSTLAKALKKTESYLSSFIPLLTIESNSKSKVVGFNLKSGQIESLLPGDAACIISPLKF